MARAPLTGTHNRIRSSVVNTPHRKTTYREAPLPGATESLAADPVAIVGRGAVLPGSRDLDQFWEHVRAARSLAREAPAGRWIIPPDAAFDARVAQPDSVYSKRGCFVEEFEFRNDGLNIDEELAASLDPVFLFALTAAHEALRDARLDAASKSEELRRTGVVLGNIVLPTERTSEWARATLGATFAEAAEAAGWPLSENHPAGARIRSELPGAPSNETAALAQSYNRYPAGLPAGLVAKALGLGGGTVTLDAACASSLYALYIAARELQAGRADAMLAGGLSRPDCLYTQMGFAQLRALSPSGVCSPFDGKGNGLVVGEGAGVVVLKRLSDALAAGDRIYGVLRGFGLSNDVGGSLLAPDSEGQLRAMRAAYLEAGWSPADVDLIECHATGTPRGDAVEFASLQALWENEPKRARGPSPDHTGCVIGSVKSNVGHLLTGAGAAGLLKILLALENQTLPPTANFEAAASGIDLEASPFRVLPEAVAWERREPSTPRRAAVSAFGFGGINAHVLVEEWLPAAADYPEAAPSSETRTPDLVVHNTSTAAKTEVATPGDAGAGSTTRQVLRRGRRPRSVPGAPIAIVGMETHFGPWSSLERFTERVLGAVTPDEPTRPSWWGADSGRWLRDRVGDGLDGFRAFSIDELKFPLERFRIPPKELSEMLPQQLLMLLVASGALEDAGLPAEKNLRTGVFVGIGLDFNTTNFHVRWSLERWIRALVEAGVLDSGSAEKNLAQLRESFGPPLTANRTMGALGGIVASRIAREFRVGGPSFTLSAEEASGLRALEIATRALQRGDLDQALVGAVDFGTDLRSVLTTVTHRDFASDGSLRPFDANSTGTVLCDGAAAVVLKPLEAARADNDRIYAVLRGIGTASGGSAGSPLPDARAYRDALRRAHSDAGIEPSELSLIETNGSGCWREDELELDALRGYFDGYPGRQRCVLGSVKGDIGHAGAAAGLASLVKAALCLHHQRIPALRGSEASDAVSEAFSPLLVPRTPRHWLRDRVRGPRRAGVTAISVDGNCTHAVLEESPVAGRTDGATAKEFPAVVGSQGGVSRRELPTALFTFGASSLNELVSQLEQLERRTTESAGRSPQGFAAAWWHAHRGGPTEAPLRLAFLAADPLELREQLAESRRRIQTRQHNAPLASGTTEASLRERLFFSASPLAGDGKLAFVYPGSGNVYAGMGRALALAWPEVVRRQDADSELLRSQLGADFLWDKVSDDGGETTQGSQRDRLLAQVAFGTLVADLLQLFGVQPDATIGYSLGETTAFFATQAWRARDAMYQRTIASPLFDTELGAPYDAARRAWRLPADESVDWIAGIIDRSPSAVDEAIRSVSLSRDAARVYVLVIHTDNECVIGGQRSAVERVLQRLAGNWLPFEATTTVHCPIVEEVADAYRHLHRLPTTAPEGVAFYSGAWGKSYPVTETTAADALVAQATQTVDFRALIRAAYEDGVRTFVEIGPRASCTRLIDLLLQDRPHLAVPAAPSADREVESVLTLLAKLVGQGFGVNLDLLYGPTAAGELGRRDAVASRQLTVPVGGKPFRVPPPSRSESEQRVGAGAPAALADARESASSPPAPPHSPPGIQRQPDAATTVSADAKPKPSQTASNIDGTGGTGTGITDGTRAAGSGRQAPPAVAPAAPTPKSPAAKVRVKETPNATPRATPSAEPTPNWTTPASPPATPDPTPASPLLARVQSAQDAAAAAHAAFLRVASDGAELIAVNAAVQAALAAGAWSAGAPTPNTESVARQPVERRDVVLTREECLRFAIGNIGDVLGAEFSPIDAYPTRVRLPDAPLMLVDRITELEAEPRSMTHGRVVTEHDVLVDGWYLDNGKLPTCIAVEAGQADLFLSGYLGIDLETRGLAVYRLLDAVVTFHRSLPRAGDVVRYEIHIDEFFRQGDNHFFRFRFESTVNGEPLLSMRNGCAGFFSATDLEAGAGVVQSRLDREPRPGLLPDDWKPLVPMEATTLDAGRIDALRRGDLGTAFGPGFAALPLAQPVRLPGSESEAVTGTPSHEGPRGDMRLVHRVSLLEPHGGRFGLGRICGEADIHPDDWFITCHFIDDQVMPGTLMYECCLHTLRIFLLRMGWVGEEHEVHYEPVPGISSQLKCRGQVLASTSQVTYEIVIKELGYRPEPYAIADAIMYADGKPIVDIRSMSLRLTGLTRERVESLWETNAELRAGDAFASMASTLEATNESERTAIAPNGKPVLYDSASILAFAIGKPSEAFGEPYRVFDAERTIARLPGPPYKFLDRITAVDAEPWVLKAGGSIEAEYDIPADEWYFEANRQREMPFAVLLEIALQPCGWFAAYMGSALTSDVDLSFRNLGGTATLHRPVTPHSGTLTTAVKVTNISSSGGMIIQHFDFHVRAGADSVYEGNTYFGFFSKAALANQVGVRDASLYSPSSEEEAAAVAFTFPEEKPFPDERLRMLDAVDLFVADGGDAGLGFIRGSKTVRPEEWFFEAHFFQDPVWPGSLGLEAFLQLLKVVAKERWGATAVETSGFRSMALGSTHRWIYRGQVIPTNRRVSVEAAITSVDDANRTLHADGFLTVDGRIIYEMRDFSLQSGSE